MTLYRPLEAAPGTLRFKLFHLGAPVTLSDSLPMLEHMGLRVLDERPHRVAPHGQRRRSGCTISACRRRCRRRRRDRRAARRCSRTRSAASSAARSRTTTSTGWSSPRACRRTEIVVLRAYAKYLRQIGFPLSQAFIEATLAAHADIARDAGRALQGALRSRAGREARDRARRANRCSAIEAALDSVENLSEDRVLRQYLALILATTRTNFWRRDAAGNRRSFPLVQVRPGARCRDCPSPSRCSRSSSTRRASKACTCAAARSRAAGCAGPTGPRISAPRCSAWSRRRW